MAWATPKGAGGEEGLVSREGVDRVQGDQDQRWTQGPVLQSLSPEAGWSHRDTAPSPNSSLQ